VEVNGMTFDLKMQKLLDDTNALLGNKELKITFVEDLVDEEIMRIDGGAYAKKLQDGNWKIAIKKNDPHMEYTLSHEILHVLLDESDFPNIYHTNSTSCCQISADIGTLICNLVHHKIIIAE